MRSACAMLLVASLLVAAGCGGPRHSDPPNIVIITLDTTRADHLSTYGYFRETSPAFDELAAESIVFERLLVPMATTLPSHMSLLTGTNPLEHGVLANSTQGGRRFVPSAQLRSFATLSQEVGYETGGFVSAAPLKAGSGAESGFEVYTEPRGKNRSGDKTTDDALRWLEGRQDTPFLMWVHYYDAHFPFAPPEGYQDLYQTDEALEAYLSERDFAPVSSRPLVDRIDVTRKVMNRYDEELRFQDDQLKRVLDALRARSDWDDTIVVIMGDHGEGLGQHGLAAHGSTWYEQLNAPLLMRIPGEPARRVDVVLSANDVLPTLLGRVSLPQGEGLLAQSSGRDVLAPNAPKAWVLGQDTRRERTEGVPYRYALSDDRWRYFRLEHHDGRIGVELYDLDSDPYELENVAERHPDVTQRMGEALAVEIVTQCERGRALRQGQQAAVSEADPELQQQLEALGYVDGDDGDAEETMAGCPALDGES